MAFFEEGQCPAIVSVTFKSVLRKLKTGIIFTQNLTRGLHTGDASRIDITRDVSARLWCHGITCCLPSSPDPTFVSPCAW
jgi:hypothetical protein